MPVRRVLIVELPVPEAGVYIKTRPRVNGGIGLLRLRESVGLPVGKALAFGYALAKNYGIYLLKRRVRYGKAFDIGLKLYKSFRLYVAGTTQHIETLSLHDALPIDRKSVV